MSHSQFSLLKTNRFLPLFVTQALGAFNDNVLRFSVAILITYRLTQAGGDAATQLALAAAFFTLPFFLFSGIAGQLADKLDKAELTVRIKLAEIAIMAFGALALWLESSLLMFVALSSPAPSRPSSGRSSTASCRNTFRKTNWSAATR